MAIKFGGGTVDKATAEAAVKTYVERKTAAEAAIKSPPSIPQGKKKAISIRLDPDVLDWFKAQGRDWQPLMNKVLRDYMSGS